MGLCCTVHLGGYIAKEKYTFNYGVKQATKCRNWDSKSVQKATKISEKETTANLSNSSLLSYVSLPPSPHYLWAQLSDPPALSWLSWFWAAPCPRQPEPAFPSCGFLPPRHPGAASTPAAPPRAAGAASASAPAWSGTCQAEHSTMPNQPATLWAPNTQMAALPPFPQLQLLSLFSRIISTITAISQTSDVLLQKPHK